MCGPTVRTIARRDEMSKIGGPSDGHHGPVASARRSSASSHSSLYRQVPPVDDHDDENAQVPLNVLDSFYRRALVWTFLHWSILLLCSWNLAPPESFRRPESSGARTALAAASLVMSVSVVTRFWNLIGKGNMFGVKVTATKGKDGQDAGAWVSGAALVGFFAQICSALMNGTMAFVPTPVLVDPVTGMDVYLLRWVEWAPLAFIMTLLTASIDADSSKDRGLGRCLRTALCQGLSTTIGILLPLVPSKPAWFGLMAASLLLHQTLHQLLVYKTFKVLSLGDAVGMGRGMRDFRARIECGAHLIQLLAVSWSLLIVQYGLSWYFRFSPATIAVLECSVDVVSKHFYLNYLLDAHHHIFEGKTAEGGNDDEATTSKAEASAPQEQRAVVFRRGEQGATILTPSDVSPDVSVLDAARTAKDVNRAVFTVKKEEASDGKGGIGEQELAFDVVLGDGTTIVPFSMKQAKVRTLGEVLAVRGVGDALIMEVRTVASSKKKRRRSVTNGGNKQSSDSEESAL
mmetsp:Transcript_39441/g.72754  ORF Transcript_39441/g.72754 Transcript_39441/m.72754 type:complete len:516 (-) Transcript_39441:371-1918(-)